MHEREFVKFFYELGMLKRRKHDGYLLAGASPCEISSIAEHSFRAAAIAFVLARMEKCKDPYRVSVMALFHDIEETRIPDINKVANRYTKGFDKERLLKEQLDERLGEIGKEIRELRERVNYRYEDNLASLIAKDADYLEQALSAKELYEKGYESMQDWINNIGKALRTKSALKMWNVLQEVKSYEWWEGLKKIDTFRKNED
ncbi:MAG: HD domain-containing protein [Candidatus Nanohaloarchaeota archaeon]|nr:HD domain-containing protein [Candidatus Nanohaloarchaeota archaeon]